MIDVFKTNVQEAEQARELKAKLLEHFPEGRIHFDLEDCDHILRIENESVDEGIIISVLEKNGFQCEALAD